ncbi:amidase [Streptomyces samsunensis]|uniref:amidase n=1 Tax=Streptomyces malaysiensis TaxID=92644 RepID=UPI001582929A|nr:amidase [Streptomyces samsunensis]NUH40142.1 amidase [Streptomyces samsunensis]
MQPYELSLGQASRAMAAGWLSPVELTESVLGRIATMEEDLNAYVTVVAESARRAAARAEREIAAAGPRSPLHGIPMGLKDLIDTAGVPTTSGSLVRANRVPAENSTVATRLDSAGAVLIGKTHTYEFAYGLLTPQTRNPWAPERVCGGSSGGSAAAVAAGEAIFALGTDTGGSIRVPSALTGVVGLKPTYGLVPQHGVTPLSWSLDHVGPITRTVEDAGLVLNALIGHHPNDPASSHREPRDCLRNPGRDLTGLRLGVPVNYFFDHVDPQVENAVRSAVARLAGLGARLVDVEVPMTQYIQATQWGLMVPEATSYHENDLRRAPELYGPDVRVLLEAGVLVPATDYLRAQRSRTLMRRAWSSLFDRADLIAAPSVPATAARTGQQEFQWADGTRETVTDAYIRLSAPANITGIPSVSLPVGLDGAGLPIGMQLMGRPFEEATLLRAAAAYEHERGGIAPSAPLAS